ESGSGDELDQLARTLNDMLRRIRRGMLQMQRFNANAAHQLRTPLTVISSQIEITLAQERDADEYRRVIRDLLARVREVSDGGSSASSSWCRRPTASAWAWRSRRRSRTPTAARSDW